MPASLSVFRVDSPVFLHVRCQSEDGARALAGVRRDISPQVPPMQRPVVTLPPEATCAEAANLMRDENIGAVVIAEAGRPLGMVTDRDLVIRVIADGIRWAISPG